MKIEHHCHAVGCKKSVPPRLLMCKPHWALVPVELQVEVCRTVKLRGGYCDISWAPWWRAQARAIYGVALLQGRVTQEIHDAQIARADAFADGLGARGER